MGICGELVATAPPAARRVGGAAGMRGHQPHMIYTHVQFIREYSIELKTEWDKLQASVWHGERRTFRAFVWHGEI